MPHKYTAEQADFIRNNLLGHTRKEITALVNARFNLNLTDGQMTSYIKNHRFKNGLDGRFKPGECAYKVPKGTRLSPATEFKKGNRPWNYQPVGSERVNTDGYVDVKIADPKTWRAKHILLWEEANGPVPKGHKVIFGDGNRLNVALDNLILVTYAQLARLNQNHLIQSDAELTRTAVLIADLKTAISHRKRGGKAHNNINKTSQGCPAPGTIPAGAE